MVASVGSTALSAAYLGSTALNKIYVGSEQVWPVCTDVLTEPFNNLTAWTVTSFSIVGGRTGSGTASLGTASCGYSIPTPSRSSTTTVGFAWKISAIAAARSFFELREGGTIHLALWVETNGSITARRGGATVVATSAAGLIAVNTWNYIEIQTLIADVGTITVRVNGTPVITVTGVDTQNGLTGIIDEARLVGGSGYVNTYDDLYLSTGTGCSFKGDQAIVLAGTSTDELLENFTSIGDWGAGISSIAGGRSGNCGSVNGSSISTYGISAPNQSPYVTVGFAFKTSDVATTLRNIVAFRDAATSDLLTVRAATTGALELCISSATVIATSAAGLIAPATWNYLEFQAFIADSGGYATVRLNGTPVITFNGDTRPGIVGPNVANLTLRGPGSGQSTQFDDLYLTVGIGTAFKGDISVP